MANKIEIDKLDSISANDAAAVASINRNFEKVQEAINNSISRDGTVPNFMDADFDLNTHRIINGAEPVDDGDMVTLKYFKENVGESANNAAAAEQAALRAASSAQSAAISANNALASANSASNAVQGFDAHVEDKKTEFDGHVADKTAEFDTHAAQKQAQVDASANAAKQSETNAADSAATAAKTASDFDAHAAQKTQEFDTNAQQKLDDYNSNATAKTSEFDTNAQQKLDDYNSNATAKTSEFDTNAQQKLDSFNTNAAQKQAQVDASATAAAKSEDNAEIWAEGTDEQVQALGGIHSSKGWAAQSSQGQVQADWNQSDSGQKDFIKNKPDVVTKNLDETISGAKTLTSSPKVKASYAIDEVVTTDKWVYAPLIVDKNGTNIGAIAVGNRKEGILNIKLGFEGAGKNNYKSIGIQMDVATGTVETHTVKPPVGDSSYKIATTNWVRESITSFAPKEQNVYQKLENLSSTKIVLKDGCVRYAKTVSANDSFTVDISQLSTKTLNITFELILNMSTPVSFSLNSITTKWMGGDSPDLSEAGQHWFAFTSLDGGQTWIGSYEGRFAI